MSAKKQDFNFDESVQGKYGQLKTVKSFLELSIKAYDDNLQGLLS